MKSTDAHRESAAWEVPYLGFTPGAECYYTILRVRGTTDDRRSVESWIPPRGKVQHELSKFLSPQQSEIPVLDLGP